MRNFKRILSIVFVIVLLKSCTFPDKDCTAVSESQDECQSCCVANNFSNGSYELVTGDCYCEE